MFMNDFYVGGDVSKGYCDYIILNSDEEIVEKNFQLDDTAVGHQALYQVFQNLWQRQPSAVIHVGFESTGGYENNWYHSILKFSEQWAEQWGEGEGRIQVTRLNPKAVSHHKKSELKRISTDKESAYTIAHYLIAHKKRISYHNHCQQGVLQQHLEEGQNLWKFIQTLNKQKVQCCNQLQSHLYKAHPQLIRYSQEGFSNWLLELVRQYPGAQVLSQASVAEVSKIRYVTPRKAVQLIKDAKTSVASSDSPIIHSTVSALANHIMSLEALIRGQIELLALSPAIQALEEEIKILISFPGINTYSAYGIILQIVSVERFLKAKSIGSFYGLHPVFVESGDKIGQSRMSKQGASEMRRLLYLVAQTAVRKDSRLQKLYENHTEKKGSKMAALGIMMHKILRMIYGMLKHKTEYDPKVDEENQKRTEKKEIASKSKQPAVVKKRRFQAHDESAPISRRQFKKRNQTKMETQEESEKKTKQSEEKETKQHAL
jgi:transposase